MIKWIKPSNELPPYGTKVIVRTVDNKISIYSLEDRFEDYAWENELGVFKKTEYVVAWMSMSELLNLPCVVGE